MIDKLTKTIKEDLSALSRDYIEIAIDSFLQDGVLKDLPVIGSVVSLLKVGKTINDIFFTQKILYFLHGIKDIPLDRRIEMIEKIDNDPNLRIKCGEFLLAIINKVDNIEKIKFISYLYKCYMTDQLETHVALKLIFIVERIFWADLIKLTKSDIKEINQSDRPLFDTLISEGLMTIIEVGTVSGYTGGPIYAELNELGKLLKNKLIIFFQEEQ